MVVEADESDRSFLKLSPSIAVMTNIDREHMDAYGSYAELQQAFVDFANKVPFYGAVVASADDVELRAMLPRLTRRVITYGIDAEEAELRARAVVLEGFGSRCEVWRRNRSTQVEPTRLGALALQVPGRHSVANALAAVAVGLELDVPFVSIASALQEFRGAERRFQHMGTVAGVTVIDDYGHHPTEIAAVIAAARAAKPSRVVLAFQPHRYSRTRDLFDEFAAILAEADELVLTDIYPASEDPLPGVTLSALAAAVNARRIAPAHVVANVGEVPAVIAALARPGDLVLTMGAGSIGGVAPRVMAALEARSNRQEGA
jgi:UDP-N-acetylmuramate--alanine ligase